MAKIKPKIYAEVLIDGLKAGKDFDKIAENLWNSLQKNKQYRDLPRILELLDEEWAKQNNAKVVKVYSDKELSGEEKEEIANKIEAVIPAKAGILRSLNESGMTKVIIKNIIDKNTIGLMIKVDDKIIDLSVTGKINNLRKILIHN